MAEVHHLQHEKEQLLVCVRREERKRRDLSRELQRITEEQDETKTYTKTLELEIDQLKQAYRKYLGGILDGENQGENKTARSGTESSDLSWQAMVESYVQNEKRLVMEVEKSNESMRKSTLALRALYDRYRFIVLFSLLFTFRKECD
jgi:hypothetical protein